MYDLMSDTYTYDSLENKYGNFHMPAVRLYVDGNDVVQDLKLSIHSAEIILSLSEASTAVIRLNDVYDEKTQSMDSTVKNKFMLGTVVEVGIGYGSEIQKVLKGYVASLGAEFGKNTWLVITVADVRRLMMTSGVHHVLHDVKNYSDAVQTVLGRYSKLCTAEIEATDDKLEKPLSQKSNDYDFITKELIAAGCCDREFLVMGSKAYFRKPHGKAAAICSLKPETGLEKFKVESEYTDLQVDVIGYNQQEQSVVTASATVKSAEALSSVMTSTPVHNIVNPEMDTQDKAGVCAQSYADRRLDLGQKGRGICVGLPELMPGRYVEVVIQKEIANKKFYIQKVRHKINKKGFYTEFETGGWA